MRRSILSATAAAVMTLVAAPAFAQSSEASVDSLLCTFAAKCGDAAAADATATTRDAPATKGFRIARSAKAPMGAEPVRAAAATPAPATASAPTRLASRGPIATPSASRERRADLSISFELGSDRMTPEGAAKAKIFADALMRPELQGKRFMIEGHTDSSGNAAANLDLSRRRAGAVADYLASQGVERARLEVKGYGSAAPLPGHRRTDADNRRVEALLLS